jgi:hypothetical protein
MKTLINVSSAACSLGLLLCVPLAMADTSAAIECVQYDGLPLTIVNGGLENRQQNTWASVQCPISRPEFPQAPIVIASVRVKDPNTDVDVTCSLNRATPQANGGWGVASSPPAQTRGFNSGFQTLNGPLVMDDPGGATHFYLQCQLPFRGSTGPVAVASYSY